MKYQFSADDELLRSKRAKSKVIFSATPPPLLYWKKRQIKLHENTANGWKRRFGGSARSTSTLLRPLRLAYFSIKFNPASVLKIISRRKERVEMWEDSHLIGYTYSLSRYIIWTVLPLSKCNMVNVPFSSSLQNSVFWQCIKRDRLKRRRWLAEKMNHFRLCRMPCLPALSIRGGAGVTSQRRKVTGAWQLSFSRTSKRLRRWPKNACTVIKGEGGTEELLGGTVAKYHEWYALKTNTRHVWGIAECNYGEIYMKC